MAEEAPLLLPNHEPSESAKKLSDLQPCANFLLNSRVNTWYKGEIHKNNVNGVRASLEKFFLRNEYSKFISYKFVHGEHTFCITFRKETTVSKYLNNLGGINNVFLIRLSLIEEDKDASQTSKRRSDETPIKCMRNESLILEPKSFPVGIKIPTEQDAQFSSITSGDTRDQIALVIGMGVITETPNQYEVFFKSHISPHMNTLGKILVDNCNPENTPSQGGATRKHTRLSRRRKSVFKRKGKKSYRKKKYGKTKKSRRFRRSVRSRR
jgi:hypothetical protein